MSSSDFASNYVAQAVLAEHSLPSKELRILFQTHIIQLKSAVLDMAHSNYMLSYSKAGLGWGAPIQRHSPISSASITITSDELNRAQETQLKEEDLENLFFPLH